VGQELGGVEAGPEGVQECAAVEDRAQPRTRVADLAMELDPLAERRRDEGEGLLGEDEAEPSRDCGRRLDEVIDHIFGQARCERLAYGIGLARRTRHASPWLCIRFQARSSCHWRRSPRPRMASPPPDGEPSRPVRAWLSECLLSTVEEIPIERLIRSNHSRRLLSGDRKSRNSRPN
jgi:hypothetical protein